MTMEIKVVNWRDYYAVPGVGNGAGSEVVRAACTGWRV
jgi:hypothetical protein